jgi:hypothetical protein
VLARRALRPFAFALGVASAACGSSGAWLRAQHVDVVPGDGSRYWVTGSLGFAAEGRGAALTRGDFPESSDEPDWAFEAWMFPGAHVVTQRGRAYLVTQGGSIFRREGRAWRPLPTHVPSDSEDWPVQVDDVLVSPDGQDVLIHAHAQRLWHAGGEVLERGGMRAEEMPKYIWSLAFVRGRIVGTSYEGERRAIFERVSPSKWEVRGVLPVGASEVLAVVPFGEHGLAAVTYYGLHVVDEPSVRAPTRFVRAGDLVDLRAPVPEGPRASQGLVVAVDPTPASETEASQTDGGPIRSAFVLPSGRAALVFGGTSRAGHGVVLLGGAGARFYRCDLLSVRRVVGVVEEADHLLAISSAGSVAVLFSDGPCTEPQPPLIEGSP